jgi:hypothetical protein
MQPYTPDPICGEYQVQTTFLLAAFKHFSTKGRKQQKEADQCRGKNPQVLSLCCKCFIVCKSLAFTAT